MIRDLAIPFTCYGKAYETDVLVSAEDYIALRARGNWFATHGTRKDGKSYAVRSEKGVLIFMHKLVLERSGKPRPCERHTIGDHKDGNSLNNTRSNLRWATPQMNARNPFGFVTKQMELDL